MLTETAIREAVDKHRKEKNWWLARDYLESVLSDPTLDVATKNLVVQQLALCTYKDPELRRQAALTGALRRLLGSAEGSPDLIDNLETAGLAGAIHKRLWELDGRDNHLSDALRYYRRGAELGAQTEAYDAYGAINAAYVLTVQAHARCDSTSEELLQQAKKHRDEVITHFGGKSAIGQWDLASLVEAYIGNRDVDAALELIPQLQKAMQKTDVWKIESTAVQLARLGHVIDPPFPEDALMRVLGSLAPTLNPTVVGAFGHRFGVAFSGGGFRASLFHLGVLAAMAEYDLLRHVEALSCVSGGSIVGAAYYSALADLHERVPDKAIGSEELAAVVERCIATMTNAVTKHNIRMKAFFGPVTLVRGIAAGRLSRTRRGGMLYERLMFKPLRPQGRLDHLSGLEVHPVDHEPFRPKKDNLLRSAKIPTLVINATSLGTGRPWRFTATSLGEPGDNDNAVDPLDQLEHIWLDRNPPAAVDKVSVGDAVAASACVPGLFPPVLLRKLYRHRRVALVDGGVYDNQGITGLLDNDCTDIFISDASGLMPEAERPRSRMLNVLLRTNSVLLSTTRASEFAQVEEAARSGQVQNLWKIHLLSGLPKQVVPHLGRPSASTPSVPPSEDVDKAIAELRTDLDRFTTGECWALMSRGYKLTIDAFENDGHPLAAPRAQRKWAFQAIDGLLDNRKGRDRLYGEVHRGRKLFFKWVPRGRRAIKF